MAFYCEYDLNWQDYRYIKELSEILGYRVHLAER